MTHRRILETSFVIALLGTLSLAAEMPTEDVPGSKDHPLLSRYAGSKIIAYNSKQYDELWMAAGPYEEGHNPPLQKVVRLEGKVTQIAYNYPAERSSLEVMRNFKGALQKAGFRTLFECDKESCGEHFGDVYLDKKLNAQTLIFRTTQEWSSFNTGRVEPRYVLASATRPGGVVVNAGVYVVPALNDDNGGVYIEVVEGTAMETEKVTANLTADQMATSIAAEGKVALYGIYFDTDRTEIKPQSTPTLEEMAKLLKSNPKLAVYIVGHTDNQGTLAHNVDLSQRRADAVVRELVATYGVPQAQLVAKGVASLAPVASNENEAGRAKNRRVELVRQ